MRVNILIRREAGLIFGLNQGQLMQLRFFLLLILISAFFFRGNAASSQYKTLSDSAEISLLTMSPGQEELYSAFGHSALRVQDPLNRVDVVFNYGIFHFNQPNFYLNFTKGKLYYELGIRSYKRTKNYYTSINRTITEQILNLSKDEKQLLFDKLMLNAEPENAYYYYNYCYNNCSTKIRDILEEVLGDKLNYDFSYANDSLSYRQLMDLYLGQQPWGDLGIDLALGSEIDQVADGRGYMYLPEFLLESFDKATIEREGGADDLVKETNIINTAFEMPDASSAIEPIHVFVILFFVVGLAIHRGLKYNVSFRWVDVLLFGVTGLAGCFLLFLWFGTDHLSQANYNLIWCTPLSLIALILLLMKKTPAWLRYYFVAFGGLMVLQILFRELFVQELHFAFIPLVLTLAIRSFYLAYVLKSKP